MSRLSFNKKKRQEELMQQLKELPFLTDEELAEIFSVSIPTIRLDRIELGIPEVRQRVKMAAQKNYDKVKTIKYDDMMGELMELIPGVSGVSILETAQYMAFSQTRVVQGRYIYAMAESLAIAVIDANVALVGIANIKYNIPCYWGGRLFAKARVKKVKGNKYIVWVTVMEKQVEIFKGKFMLVSLDKMPDRQ